MQVFGYCRVSTTEQADDGVSLAAQKQQIAGYAMMKGWKLAEVFIEAGVSGSVTALAAEEQSVAAGHLLHFGWRGSTHSEPILIN